MGNIYNPFNKNFEEVTEEDLEILKEIPEGWYIEYKSEKQSGKKISRSISSFANSHGGLYFVGIQEDSSTNKAKAILGVEDSPDVIRDSLKGNLSHMPFFKTISIPLKNRKNVLMVIVPEGNNPPYINSDGRIYRRQESASDPILAETSRFVIDDLYRKSEKQKALIESFRKNSFGLTREESEFPYLIIYFTPIPFKEFLVEDFKKISENNFLDFFSKKSELKFQGMNIKFNIPFDNFSTYSNSFSIRSLKNQDLSYNHLTLEIDVFGNCKMLIPLKTDGFIKENFNERYSKIIERYSPSSVDHLKIIDVNELGHIILSLTNLYKEFLLDRNFKNDLEIKIEFENGHRTTPYFESKAFFEYIEKYGLPLCMKDFQYFPSKPLFWENKYIKRNSLIDCMVIFSQAVMAMGIPSTIASKAYIESLNFKKD